jgi:CHAD domain-containing protein
VDVLPGVTHALNGASANGFALDLPPLAYQPAAEVAWQLIRDQGVALLDYRKGALSGDIDAVHDMRVAARRLRTLLDTFAPCFTEASVRQLRRAVKRMTRSLGVVRDADVAIEQLVAQRAVATTALVPGLDLLIKQHRDERRQARRTLKDDLRADRVKHLRRCLHALHLPDDKIIHAGCVREQLEPEPSMVEEGTR